METIKQDVDQLQEAASQLRRGTEISARLALILADNLVELQLHKMGRHFLAWGDLLKKGVAPNRRAKILNDFRQLANYVARKEPRFSEDDCKIANAAHQMRNEAYHRGVLRKGVVGFVARAQLNVAGLLLPMATRGWSGAGSRDIGEFFGQYGIMTGAYSAEIPKHLEQVCLMICREAIVKPDEIAPVLRDDLVARCNAVIECMESLGSYGGRSPNERLRWLHAWLVDEEEEHDDDEDVTARLQRIERLAQTDSRVVDFRTVAAWAERARRLVGRSTGDILAGFWELDQMLSPVEEMAHEAAASFDDMINNQRDEMD